MIDQVDATELTAQINDYMARFETESKEQFETWYNDVKDLLDPDAAGQLTAAVLELREGKLDRALTQISENADLDTYITDGDYRGDNLIAATIRNSPRIWPFDLRVRNVGSNVYQHWRSIDGMLEATRMRGIDAWGEWKERWPVGYTHQMAAGTDADDYTVSGDYQCPSNEVAEKIDNMPAVAAGLLEVRDIGGTIFQRYTVYTGNVIYMRCKPNWGNYAWGYWRKVYRDETGSWTPKIVNTDGLSSTATYAQNDGGYIRLGSLVICTATIELSSIGNLGSSICIVGFPYPKTKAQYPGYYGGFIAWNNLGLNEVKPLMSGADATPISWLYQRPSGTEIPPTITYQNLKVGSRFEGMTWIYFTDA